MSRYESLLKLKPVFDEYCARQEVVLSAHHFSSILAWSDFFDFTFEIIEGRLCVFAKHAPGMFMYLPPLGGDLRSSLISRCFEHMKAYTKSKGVVRIEHLSLMQVECLDLGKYKLVPRPQEYVYRRQDIVGLKGNAYKSQRHDVNVLLSRGIPQVRSISDDDLEACDRLYRAWSESRREKNDDVVYQSMLEENRGVHQLLLRYRQTLGLTGLLVEVDGKLSAYTLGYPLNTKTFVVLLEVVDLGYVGLSAFIFSRFCDHGDFKKHQWVNTMDDFGMPNVAKAKASYHPCHMQEGFTLYENT